MGWKKDLGDRIKAARKGTGITQKKLADRVGVSRQMVCRYENGSDPPSLEVLSKIASVLDLTNLEIGGMRVSLAKRAPGRPRAAGVQLNLPFAKHRTFKRAEVQVALREGKLHVTAVIPA
jgi:transcriptional regulator with XRE-family HTH domain